MLAASPHSTTRSPEPPRAPWRDTAPTDGRTRLLAALLDEIEIGVIACTADATIAYANWAACRELALERPWRAHHGRLECPGLPPGGLAAALADACLRDRRQVLGVEHGPERPLFSVSPLPGEQPLALVMQGRREPTSRLGLELFGIGHGLTPAERTVLAGLARQLSPIEVAQEQGTTIATVRTHLASIYAKLGLGSQRELMCTLAGVPPVAMAMRLTPRLAEATAGGFGSFNREPAQRAAPIEAR